MLSIYNERFNAYVARSYAGMRVAAPGLATDFELRAHQHQAIARVVLGGNTALWHPVGAGKTAEMVVAAMEMRRLGIVRRPCVRRAQPHARAVHRRLPAPLPRPPRCSPSPRTTSARKRATLFAARVRSHDWDAVVITHSSLHPLGLLSAPTEVRLIEAVLAERRHELEPMLAASRQRGAAHAHQEASSARLVSDEAKLEKLRDRVA